MNRMPIRPRKPSTVHRMDAADHGALRAALGEEDAAAALPFLEAVVQQTAFPLGESVSAAEAPERQRKTVRQVIDLLLATRAAGGEAAAGDRDEAAERLRAHPVLLAAFFQNIDLLYQQAYPHADAVSLLVMRALDNREEPGRAPGEAASAIPQPSSRKRNP
jgi:hypothetical protein